MRFIALKASIPLILILIVAVLTEGVVAIAPVLVNFNEGFEIDALAEETFEALAGFGRDTLEGNTLMTDDDAFLAFTLHVNNSIDVDVTVGLLELLYNHFA